MMDPNDQRRFMYLFERVGEPLYLGPRGGTSGLTFFNVPTEHLTDKEQNASVGFRSAMSMTASMGPPMMPMIKVNPPRNEMPDLDSLDARCPKQALFSTFDPSHRSAANYLRNVFLKQSKEELLSMACHTRDSHKVNPQLWIFALASAIVERKDMVGFQLPPVWEIMPDQFISPQDIRLAKSQASMPTEDRTPIIITHNFTGENTNAETKLAYFREDMGVNSHHFHWHIVYAPENKETDKRRDRKGELFYYMHHGILARYDAERLANGLPFVQPFNLDEDMIEEGYFPNLHDTNSGMSYGNRQAKTPVQPLRTMPGLPVGLNDLKKYLLRIYDAIDTRMVLKKGGEMVPLNTDILGDMVENGGRAITPNLHFYGSFHNTGHNIIAGVQDPTGEYKAGIGVMSATQTAMRDPVFYRWHKLVDNIFLYWQLSHDPRPYGELIFPSVEVTSIKVASPNRTDNILFTHWNICDIDLARGLDFGRTSTNMMGPITATLKKLDHEPFTYTIKVENKGRTQLNGTVRIFMAPKWNEHNEEYKSGRQWAQFFEMDKFPYLLQPGENTISRRSDQSSVAIPWEQSFAELEKKVEKGQMMSAESGVCGCGWPQHMLLPRGTVSGMDFDLFVMVTDGSKDQIPRTKASTNKCRESTSYCGILDEKYPDKLPMGYPFDRSPPTFGEMVPVNDLQDFTKNVPNASSQHIKIVHTNKDVICTNPEDNIERGRGQDEADDHPRRPQKRPESPRTNSRPSQSPPNRWDTGRFPNRNGGG